MIKPTRTIASLLLLAVPLAACGSDEEDTGAGGSTEETGDEGSAAATSGAVSIVDFDFEPKTITAKAGEEITFTNDGDVAHTASAKGGEFDTDTLNGGESATVTVDEPGTYEFFCAFHPVMKGELVVE